MRRSAILRLHIGTLLTKPPPKFNLKSLRHIIKRSYIEANQLDNKTFDHLHQWIRHLPSKSPYRNWVNNRSRRWTTVIKGRMTWNKCRTNEDELPTKGKQMVSPARNLIPNLPDHVIKMRDLQVPCKDRAPKISKRKLTSLKASHIVNNGLAGGRSRIPNVEVTLVLANQLLRDRLIMVQEIHKPLYARSTLICKNNNTIRKTQVGDRSMCSRTIPNRGILRIQMIQALR